MDTNTFIQFILAIVAITSAILIYKTIKSNKDLNQKIIFKFQEGYAKKENYAGIQWLFKKWNI